MTFKWFHDFTVIIIRHGHLKVKGYKRQLFKEISYSEKLLLFFSLTHEKPKVLDVDFEMGFETAQ